MNALNTCYTLRKAGYKPLARMLVNGRQLELISYPFPNKGGIGIMVREPDDSTTMIEWSIPTNIIRMAVESFG